MWTVSLQDDPLWDGRHRLVPIKNESAQPLIHACLVKATCLLESLFQNNPAALAALKGSGRCGQVALADYVGRLVSDSSELCDDGDNNTAVQLESLERQANSMSRGPTSRRLNGRNKKNGGSGNSLTPLILERSDVSCSSDDSGSVVLELWLRALVFKKVGGNGATANAATAETDQLVQRVEGILQQWWTRSFHHQIVESAMRHVATAVVQNALRETLHEQHQAVAFVANQAILPRKSGATQAPMASPPAVPFMAPTESDLCRTVKFCVPRVLLPYLSPQLVLQDDSGDGNDVVVSLTGLLIPRGVSLIVGGGYHGKSTLLRCIAAGVYNKIPGDGREFCVTVKDALTIRAEDGRYVNNCNVNAFISNLPTPPAASNGHAAKANNNKQPLDTKHFSTAEASGSTSQAANVMEALELRTTAFLVDEDVSAANFMARDGRMRALVMDESITPLLYRVNGLFQTHGVSSIVVVGGVGDWLDVPHSVILMQQYSCFDATAKARSISKQFSHGHVQYGGRGVVHRLEWNAAEHTPIPRRPTTATAAALDKESTVLGLLDGGTGLVFHTTTTTGQESDDSEREDDEEDRYVDMSRCEQLLGKRPQLYGCGLAALWVLEASRRHPHFSLSALLDRLDTELDQHGVLNVLAPHQSATRHELVETLGHAYRPRRLEVGQAICRLRGIEFQEAPNPSELDAVAAAKARADAEEERKKQELMELWNSRRKYKLING